jgi:hypothetical protein
MGLFDGWDWEKIATGFGAGLVNAAPAIVAGGISAYNSSRANTQAADIAARTRDANVAATSAANDRAIQTLSPMVANAQPAQDYLRSVMATNPYALTPQQDQEMKDRMLLANRSLPSAFRGSGRATSAVLNDTMNRGRAGMIDQNMRRSDAAAGSLNSSGTSATNNIASIQAGAGRQVAGFNDDAGTNQANALTATADSNNSAIASIASYFANASKDNEREGRYGRAKQTLQGV